MHLKAFSPLTRKIYPYARLDQERNTIRPARGGRVPREQFVLLPPVGLAGADGLPIYLGDAFTRNVDGRTETFIVGPLPGLGELVREFTLRGFRADLSERPEPQLQLEPDVVATLTRAGNVYENFEKFVPANAHHCYKGLGWDGQFYHIALCPFWHRSEHGMVYCRLTQRGSLPSEAGKFEVALPKAIAHFGSEEAVYAADTDTLLWDQVKSCGVNEFDPESGDETLISSSLA